MSNGNMEIPLVAGIMDSPGLAGDMDNPSLGGMDNPYFGVMSDPGFNGTMEDPTLKVSNVGGLRCLSYRLPIPGA